MKRLLCIAGAFAFYFAIGFIIVWSWFGVARAQTAAEIRACKPDALRLCSAGAIIAAMLGDHRYVFACLTVEHRRELKPPCDRVLRSHGY